MRGNEKDTLKLKRKIFLSFLKFLLPNVSYVDINGFFSFKYISNNKKIKKKKKKKGRKNG